MKPIGVILILIFSIIPRVGAAQSEQEESFDTFSIYMENDLFAGTDQGYTGGLKMSWSIPVYRTKQFKKQDYNSIFGAFSFIFFF